ncbi:MAG: hypothetical protein SGJ10_01075 [Bacteroidota bacterium]|nr:hypothetical protein [Bacteroidota bacterium]
MLNKIILINTKVYQKAEINLGDCDSLQLVGPNNVGKSTLIYALNFLFIVDGNKMTFSGQRRGDKETLHHYFPSPNQSYILFEIHKKTYYTILVKRDSDSNLEYFRIDSAYNKDYFIDADSKLLKFEEVKENLMKHGVTLYEYKDKREVFMEVYQRGRKNNGVVWLDDKVRMDGLSNNFSKIYRYLINTKLITNKNLKEALLVADNREMEELNFSQKNKKDITDLSRINNEIRNVKAVRGDFEEFREAVGQYGARQRAISELYYAFSQQYEETVPVLQNNLMKERGEMDRVRMYISEELHPKQEDLTRKQGKNDSDIENKTFQLLEKENKLKLINSYEGVPILNEMLANHDKNRKEIESRITMVDIQNLTPALLEQKIKTLKERVQLHEQQIKNFKNLLIHNIAEKESDRKLLNTIFSEQISSLPIDNILKKISKTGKKLNLFDGEIDISKGIILKDLKTIEELKAELADYMLDLQQQEVLLKVVQDKQKTQDELEHILREIELIKFKLAELKTRPKLIESITAIKDEVKELLITKKQLEQQSIGIKKDIEAQQLRLEEARSNRDRYENRLTEIQTFKQELEGMGLTGVEAESELDLDRLYKRIKLQTEERNILKSKKDSLFQKLKEKLLSNFASEEEFINYYDEEIGLIDSKERSIEGLLESISTQFANPAYTLLKRFEEFQEFVVNNFNQKLGKTRISDIESLRIELIENRRLMDELKKISKIQEIKGQMMFDFDQSESLKILNHYLDTSKKIKFEDLFDMTLHLTRKGQSRPVDLSEQIESDGTDKMIRLVIVMNIINRLAINDEENRIALFIDEVATIDKQNRPELVRFCREHHFIPIFAAPDAVPGFGKYYFIYPSAGKISINENHHAVYAEAALLN